PRLLPPEQRLRRQQTMLVFSLLFSFPVSIFGKLIVASAKLTVNIPTLCNLYLYAIFQENS
ncbi:MAG TPA: hypothetical protein IAA05_14620, partial [Candidatus Blautia excrementipullorum]|nr:hypothetical protein [Candidatus Blautia excrementipullorum]